MRKVFAVVTCVVALAACGSSNKTSVATKPDVGPQVREHWHAALGVWDCDHWVGDGSGEGVWAWPGVTDDGHIVRVGTETYAGLHSHGDGIMHMEPATQDDAGANATVGRYFDYGGWKVDDGSYTFLGSSRASGDKCGDAPGTFAWSVNGKEQTGNPGDYKLMNDDVVVIAWLPSDKTLADIGKPPSAANLADAPNNEGQTPPGAQQNEEPAGPCVARTGELPEGAPDVPVEPGSPPTKLVTKDVKVGTGDVAVASSTVTVDYILVACTTGEVIDSSYASGQQATFGLDQVIPGWQKGIPGMRVGGRRLLVVPPADGYGAQGSGPVKPNETLWFVVDLAKVG
jgi:peptidylprolyl isomerase